MRGAFSAGLAIVVACSGPDEPHPCDEGTPTCESALVVALPDPRTAFTIHVDDTEGMSLDVDCPIPDTGSEQLGDYSVICGAGRLTISTFRFFGDTIDVQLEESEVRSFTPDYQKGADYCGNTCTTGTVQL
jgi:hypothetical protein